MNITAILSALMGMHALAGVAWLGVSLHAAFGQTAPISRNTRKAQGVLAVFVFLFGFFLWRYLHSGAFGEREVVLVAGAIAAIAAAGMQHGAGKPLARRWAATPEADVAGRAVLAKKIHNVELVAAVQLAVALLLMVIARFV